MAIFDDFEVLGLLNLTIWALILIIHKTLPWVDLQYEAYFETGQSKYPLKRGLQDSNPYVQC